MNDKSCFIDFFGDTPTIRILDFLIENKFFAPTKKQIIKGSGVKGKSFSESFKKIREAKCVVEIEKGHYRFNRKSEIVEALMRVELELCRQCMNRYLST